MVILPAFGGILSSIVSGIMRIILTPIFELIGFLLRTILGPIFTAVLTPLIQIAIDLVLMVLSSIFFTILQQLLVILETFEKGFLIFAGVSSVTYNGKSTNMLRLFVLSNSQVTRAFWAITLIGLVLCMFFTIYATARSAFDFDFENKRPVGKVLRALSKSCFTFLIIPVFVAVSLELSVVLMTQLYNVTKAENLSLSDITFQITAMTANRDKKEDLNNSSGSGAQSFTTGMRASFNNGGWKNYGSVKAKFDFAKMDFIVGYVVVILLIFIVGTTGLVMIQRLLELILLYVSAPLYVSAIPLDDGQKFNGWRDLFIGKLASGMGTVMLMNVYLLTIRILMSSDIKLDPRTSGGGKDYITYEYMLKILFVIGGALAVKNGGSMLTTLISSSAGMSEQQNTQSTGAIVSTGMAMTGGMALTAGLGAGMGAGVLAAKGVMFTGRKVVEGIQKHKSKPKQTQQESFNADLTKARMTDAKDQRKMDVEAEKQQLTATLAQNKADALKKKADDMAANPSAYSAKERASAVGAAEKAQKQAFKEQSSADALKAKAALSGAAEAKLNRKQDKIEAKAMQRDEEKRQKYSTKAVGAQKEADKTRDEVVSDKSSKKAEAAELKRHARIEASQKKADEAKAEADKLMQEPPTTMSEYKAQKKAVAHAKEMQREADAVKRETDNERQQDAIQAAAKIQVAQNRADKLKEKSLTYSKNYNAEKVDRLPSLQTSSATAVRADKAAAGAREKADAGAAAGVRARVGAAPRPGSPPRPKPTPKPPRPASPLRRKK